jgi:hypothetical protein
MTDPKPATLRPRPRRAQPLQPDLPGRGQKVEDDDSPADEPAADQQKEQSETALDNVRDGYR